MGLDARVRGMTGLRVAYEGFQPSPSATLSQVCHPEQSEGSRLKGGEFYRVAVPYLESN